jgi:RHS repeat-associated protein
MVDSCQLTVDSKNREPGIGGGSNNAVHSTPQKGSFSICSNPYKYSGYYLDTESALSYCQARYYSPDLMRFINRDTYDVPNRYAYCDGNPVEYSDPNGHTKRAPGGICSICGTNSIYRIDRKNYCKSCLVLGGEGQESVKEHPDHRPLLGIVGEIEKDVFYGEKLSGINPTDAYSEMESLRGIILSVDAALRMRGTPKFNAKKMLYDMFDNFSGKKAGGFYFPNGDSISGRGEAKIAPGVRDVLHDFIYCTYKLSFESKSPSLSKHTRSELTTWRRSNPDSWDNCLRIMGHINRDEAASWVGFLDPNEMYEMSSSSSPSSSGASTSTAPAS